MQYKLLLIAFLLVTIFDTRLEIITETLLTRLINGDASRYEATFKTTEALS